MPCQRKQERRSDRGFGFIMLHRPRYSASQRRELNSIYGSLKRGAITMSEAFELRKSVLP